MTDFSTITAILGNLKVATDIARAIRDSDISIERAELRLKLAEVIGALADAKIEVTDIQELLRSKELELSELKEAFETKDDLVKRYDGYYHKDNQGNAIGEPYCISCWQTKHKRFNLQYVAGDRTLKACVSCGSKFNSRLAQNIARDDVET